MLRGRRGPKCCTCKSLDLAIKRTELRTARVNLATKLAILLTVIGLGVLTLIKRSQVRHDRERPVDAHAAAEKRVVVLVADQAAHVAAALLRLQFLPAGDVRVVDMQAPAGGKLAADGAHAALAVGDGAPADDVEAVLLERLRGRDQERGDWWNLRHLAED